MKAVALDREIQQATAWLKQQAQGIAYGEVSVRLIMHGGMLTRTERTITSKLQPVEGNGHEQSAS